MNIGTYSPEDNKLRLKPSERLDPATYTRVTEAGFSWAPKQGFFVAGMWTPDRADLLTELCGEIVDEDTTLIERAEARADRFEDYSAKRLGQAHEAHKAVEAVAGHIPLGQPILIGHHSEDRARREAEKIETGMRKAVDLWEKAEFWTARAGRAIRAAKYKERPDVRARRIKGLQSDLRKHERSVADSKIFLKMWAKLNEQDDQEKAHTLALKLAGMDRHLYGTWDALNNGKITVSEAASKAIATHNLHIATAERWIAHISNRIVYEKAMLEEAGGIVTDKVGPEVGGAVRCWCSPRNGFSYIRKVNKVSVSVEDNFHNGGANFTRTIPFDKLGAVMTKAQVEAARAEGRLIESASGIGFLVAGTVEPVEQTAAASAEVPEETASVEAPPIAETPVMAQNSAAKSKVSLADDVLDVLRGAVFTEDSVTLAGNLDRALYLKVNKALESVGGIWNRKRKAHVFAQDPRELFDLDGGKLETGKVSFDGIKAALKAGVQAFAVPQLFPTPAHIAKRMVQLAEIPAADPQLRILEPSAGTGNILAEIFTYGGEIVAVEVNQTLADNLATRYQAVDVRCADFLQCNGDIGKVDRVLMNPPFARGQDVQHITHALSFLRPGGKLVAICANGTRQQEQLLPLVEQYTGTWEPLPEGTFMEQGTGVNTVMLSLTVPDVLKVSTQEPPVREGWLF
jgi:protein-L-isoaspartate O-methyltransferase